MLRGGLGAEYPESLEVGTRILDTLSDLGYPTKDIIITRSAEWLDGGRVRAPLRALEGVDVAFIALRGHFAEDGQVQRLIARAGIPYTGSRAIPTAIAYNKRLAKDRLRRASVRLPRHHVYDPARDDIGATIERCAERFGPEYMIKPVCGGSSLHLVHVRPGASLRDALQALTRDREESTPLLIEEFIRGREATVALLHDYRREPQYVFPTVELATPVESPYHTAADKRANRLPISTPGRFSLAEREALMNAVRTAHSEIGLDQYSRADCIVRDGEVYFLEINPLPQLHTRGLYAEAAAAAGCRFEELIEHLVRTAKPG